MTSNERAGGCGLPHDLAPTDSLGHPVSPCAHRLCTGQVLGARPITRYQTDEAECFRGLWCDLSFMGVVVAQRHQGISQGHCQVAREALASSLPPTNCRPPAPPDLTLDSGAWGDRPGTCPEGGQLYARGIRRRPVAGRSGTASPRRVPLWLWPRESFRNPGLGGCASECLPGSGKLSTDPKDFLGPELRPERKHPNY